MKPYVSNVSGYPWFLKRQKQALLKPNTFVFKQLNQIAFWYIYLYYEHGLKLDTFR